MLSEGKNKTKNPVTSSTEENIFASAKTDAVDGDGDCL